MLIATLGVVLQDRDRIDDAVACYRKALQINPNFADAYNDLGIALYLKGSLSESIESYSHALILKSDHVEAYSNLGNTYQYQGNLDKAEECYREALRIKPDFASCYSNLLLSMNYDNRYDAQTIASEHLKFAKQIIEPLSFNTIIHTNERIPARKLKIGYVSPDFRRHPVAYFIEPVIISHNREYFEVFCYSNSLKHDEVTKRIQDHADQWRNIAGMSDERVTELIRKDNIDILVDLAGHTDRNRILVFARKPTPIQVSWIGYCATTGLSTIDYRIADSYTDPVGMTEQFYSEELIRLSESFSCYLPAPDSPDIGILPSLTSGHVTFGSFNNFAKVSSVVLSLWIKILKTVPSSRLIMKARSLADKTVCQNLTDLFIRAGIDISRIELVSQVPSIKEHLGFYNRVDIGLDTFPYNGTTTTCEAIWMGVPVVTLAGKSHASRVGVSLLSNVGLPELIAKTSDEYISIAVNLANDLKKLQSFRECLRDMMMRSPLCDAKRFTAKIEMCYRKMWETWCKAV